MLLKINHETRYNYDKPVQYGLQQLRLRPKERPGQRILDWNIEIEGGLVELSFEDQHCNHVDLINIERGRSEIVIRCTGEVENTDGSGVIGYVSGYLMMSDRVDQDATHAWAEAYVEHIGWVGFDVSNGYSPDERYVRVATGLDYRDASPITGLRYGAGSEDMIVSLQVQQ